MSSNDSTIEPPVHQPPLAAEAGSAANGAERRRRGRPLEMSPERVLERIRELSRREDGLFRPHRCQGGLYSRARRLFGSWSAAVEAAGVDYRALVGASRRRSQRNRRRNAARPSLRRR